MRFEVIALAPSGGLCGPGLPMAAVRAGARGVVDLTLTPPSQVESTLDRVVARAPGQVGVLLDGSDSAAEDAAFGRASSLRSVVLAGPRPDLAEAVARWRDVVPEVGLVVTSEREARLARDLAVDFILAKGHEAGGRVGADSTFVLLQKVLAVEARPVYAWGGIGLHSAAAACAGGAAGVVLDWQLALLQESALAGPLRRRIARMDGSETVAVPAPGGFFRCYDRPGMTARAELQSMADRDASAEEWQAELQRLATEPSEDRRLLAIGQDAVAASDLAARFPSVGRLVGELRRHVEAAVDGAARARALDRDGPLARSHGTAYPIVQGPMTHVSDVPEFCEAVCAGGALPFLALALMRGEAHTLLAATRERMGPRPWGVGVLGFAEREVRAEQLAAIEKARPPFAIIAGGRPDQAARFEEQGIATYLHVPSPVMLEGFLAEGARRFIFEGRECGGHVGPLGSFVLWNSMVGTILRAELPRAEAERVHVLFAGGIHDARSAAMVAALAQPLVERGARVGVLLGTAYLFTREIVASGALVEGFQELALKTGQTEVLELSPGHAIRCGHNDYTERFEAERAKLRRSGTPPAEITEKLEALNRGRLRVASKGIDRAPEARGTVTAAEGIAHVPVAADTQRREGMFMLGQVATLRTAVTSVGALHEEVGPGSADFLDRVCQRLEPAPHPRPAAPPPLDIAIVGLGCLLPDATDPRALWDNILAGHDAVREIPPDRFDASVFFDADRDAPDRIYSRWGGFLPDLPFDPLRYGIPPSALPSIEPAQLLTLLLVEQVLRDSGYAGHNPFRDRTSVILGAGGGMGELASNYTTRATLPQHVSNPEEGLYERLPEWTEDSFAGILLNVIAGRASNRFDLGGLNFTIDAACASSLAAVYLGCRELAEGTSDLVIAGGVDTVQNPMGYMCFSKTQALSPRGRSRAFDASADGIVISEGLAAVMLKRREDAERDGDRIYALVRGAAGGSDGRQKSLTAPCVSGQLRTLRRAYAQARVDPASLGLYEAHGTGTRLGDPTESRAVAELLREAGAASGSVALGSLKSMIGHTKAAAGVAGLLKAALALDAGVLPPTLHVDSPNPDGDLEGGPLCLNTETRPWVRHGAPRRAAVSAFGFGGANFHVVLEEYEGRLGPSRNPRRSRPSEVFAFSAGETDALVQQVRAFAASVRAARDAGAEMALADLAYTLHCRRRSPAEARRAAVVAGDVEELLERLDALAHAVETGGDSVRGVFFEGEPLGPGTPLAFLFPGQGSQYVNMLRDLAVEFGEVRECLERADLELEGAHDLALSRSIYPPPVFSSEARGRLADELRSTDVAQPALGVCEVALLRLLESFGVRPDLTAGHSYGELVALHAAGALDEGELYRLSWERARSMLAPAGGSGGGDLGGMVSIRADENAVGRVIEGLDGAWISNLNGPRQTTVSGTQAGLDRVVDRCEEAGLHVTRLAVACGFHSPLVAHARERFAGVLRDAALRAPALAVFNNATAQRYPEDPGEVRRLLAENLVRQVRFADEVEAIHAAGVRLFVEVGPGDVLARLVDQVLGDRPHASLPLDVRGREGLTQLHHGLAALFAHGVSVDLERLYSDRTLEELDLAALQARPRPEIGPYTWLVNGAYARPATQGPRDMRSDERVSLGAAPGEAPREAAARPVPGVELPVPDAASTSGAFGEFQQTMRAFLRTQESVLTAFLGGGVAQVPRVAPEVLPVPAVVAPAQVAPGPEERHDGGESDTRDASTGVEPSTLDVEATLLRITSERTGYPPEVLQMDADLEADYSIDSIKRVEIVAAVRRQVRADLDKPPARFMEEMSGARTLSAILAGLRRLADGADTAPAENPPANSPTPGTATAAGPAVEGPAVSAGSVRCVVEPAAAPLNGAPAGWHPDGLVLVSDDGHGVARALIEVLESGGVRATLLSPEVLATRDAVVAAVEGSRRAHGPVRALIHLLPLCEADEFPGIDPSAWRRHVDREVRGLLLLLQSLEPELSGPDGLRVLSASRGGGDFVPEGSAEARQPWRGGLAGLLKTAAREWKDAWFRAVDFDDLPAPHTLLRELAAPGPVEVGWRGGERLTVRAVRSDLEENGNGADPHLRAGDVVLATGGARGITAEVLLSLAERAAATFVLLGRSPAPGGEEDPETAAAPDASRLRAVLVEQARERGRAPVPREVEARVRSLLAAREIRRTLAAMEKLGARAEYVPCDVTDASALERVVRDVTGRLGGVDVVVHGAGAIEDRLIPAKSVESFDRVVRTKIDPVLTLQRVLDPERLRAVVLFSSVAGFYGNPGQSDYAAANEALNRMARRLRDVVPAKVVAFNWGPWGGTGMVTPEVARQFAERGIGLVEPAAGRLAGWLELRQPTSAPVRVIIGPGPWAVSGNGDGPESPDTTNGGPGEALTVSASQEPA